MKHQPTLFPNTTPDRVHLERVRFDGAVFDKAKDSARLAGQIMRVYDACKDGQWRTVGEIAGLTGDPETSVSAQLRNLRKRRFGGYLVERRQRGSVLSNLWEYRLVVDVTR
jgi:hypothetical protein